MRISGVLFSCTDLPFLQRFYNFFLPKFSRIQICVSSTQQDHQGQPGIPLLA